jgi:hypothetical protein
MENPPPPDALALAETLAPTLTSMPPDVENRGVSMPAPSAVPRQSVGSAPAAASAGPIGLPAGSGCA